MPINKITHVCLTHDKVRARNKRIPPHLSLTAIDGVSCSIIMNFPLTIVKKSHFSSAEEYNCSRKRRKKHEPNQRCHDWKTH